MLFDSATFEAIPYGESVKSEANLVSSLNGLRNLGYIVTLDDQTRSSSLAVYSSSFS